MPSSNKYHANGKLKDGRQRRERRVFQLPPAVIDRRLARRERIERSRSVLR